MGFFEGDQAVEAVPSQVMLGGSSQHLASLSFNFHVCKDTVFLPDPPQRMQHQGTILETESNPY